MRARTREKANKGLSIMLACLLVLLLVPVIPGTQKALAAEELITEFAYDGHTADDAGMTFTQSNPLDALERALADDSDVTPKYDSGDDTFDSKVEAAILTDIEGGAISNLDAFEVEITPSDANSWTVSSATPSVAEGDGGILTLVDDNGMWVFTASSEGIATVNVAMKGTDGSPAAKLTYSFAYKVTSNDNPDSVFEGEASVEVVLDFYKYDIVVSNAWAGTNAIDFEVVDLVYGTSKSIQLIGGGVPSGKSLVGAVVPSDYEEYFTLSVNGDGTVSITPRKAFDLSSSPLTAVVEWTYPDGVLLGNSTITVASAARKQVDLSDMGITLDYRHADDQRAEVAKVIEEELASHVVGSGSLEIDSANFVFGTYPTDDENGGEAEFSGLALQGEGAENYAVVFPKVATIEAVGSVGASSLALKSGENGNIDPESWVNEDVSASYAGHTLSASLNGDYATSLSLNNAEGAYSNQTAYAKNDTTNVIAKVSDISYKLDKTAPQFVSYSIGQPKKAINGIFFFETVCEVTVAIADLYGGDAQGQDPSEPTKEVSGLSNGGDDVVITYTDTKGGDTKTASAARSGDATQSTYVFTIDGDQDVVAKDLAVEAVDNAGNVLDSTAEAARVVPADVLRLVTDSAAPVVSISYDNNSAQNESFYNANRKMTVNVSDPHFSYLQEYDGDQVIVTITENGEVRTYSAKAFEPAGGDNWQVSYTFAADANCTVEASAVDLVGKSSNFVEHSFTIDKTAPAMEVSFDNNNVRNGRYYNAARTATITVTEHNFNSADVNVVPSASAGNGTVLGSPVVSGWTSDGDVHVATVLFPGEGDYSLAVNGVDRAGNELTNYTSPPFVVDTIAPEVSFNGWTSGPYTGFMGNLVISATDTNIDPSATSVTSGKISYDGLYGESNPYAPELGARGGDEVTEITVTYASPDVNVRSNDGIYNATINAMDLAGNSASESMAWSINRFGSTYLITEGMDNLGRYVKAPFDLTVVEISPNGINMDSATVDLTKDTTTKTLEKGTEYDLSALVGANWPSYQYSIPADNFKSDGDYRVLLHSTTASSGQSNENTDLDTLRLVNRDAATSSVSLANESAAIAFGVDATNPIVAFLNVEDGDRINGDSYTAQVEIKDNLLLGGATVVVDGVEHEFTADQLKASSVQEIVIDGKASEQLISVVAYDAAGNEVSEEVEIVVTSNIFYLYWPFMLGAVVVIAGAGYVIFRRKSGKEEQV